MLGPKCCRKWLVPSQLGGFYVPRAQGQEGRRQILLLLDVLQTGAGSISPLRHESPGTTGGKLHEDKSCYLATAFEKATV